MLTSLCFPESENTVKTWLSLGIALDVFGGVPGRRGTASAVFLRLRQAKGPILEQVLGTAAGLSRPKHMLPNKSPCWHRPLSHQAGSTSSEERRLSVHNQQATSSMPMLPQPPTGAGWRETPSTGEENWHPRESLVLRGNICAVMGKGRLLPSYSSSARLCPGARTSHLHHALSSPHPREPFPEALSKTHLCCHRSGTEGHLAQQARKGAARGAVATGQVVATCHEHREPL